MVVASSLTILEAHLSQHSVRGVLKFTQSAPGDPVTIHANLSVAREYKGEYSWGIYPFPIGKKYIHTYICSTFDKICCKNMTLKLQDHFWAKKFTIFPKR